MIGGKIMEEVRSGNRNVVDEYCLGGERSLGRFFHSWGMYIKIGAERCQHSSPFLKLENAALFLIIFFV